MPAGGNTNIMGNPLSELAKRAVMVFAFWFCITMVICVAYNELVVHKRVQEFCACDDEEPDAEPEPGNLRLRNTQILSFSAAVAGVAVIARIALEWIAFGAGEDTCTIISGQRITTTPSAASEGDEYIDPYSMDEVRPHNHRHDQLPPLPTGRPRRV